MVRWGAQELLQRAHGLFTEMGAGDRAAEVERLMEPPPR